MELQNKIQKEKVLRKNKVQADPAAPPTGEVSTIKRPGFIKMPTAEDYAAFLDKDIEEIEAERSLLMPGRGSETK